MLGPDGDFITSPEISQVFGEVRLLPFLLGGIFVNTPPSEGLLCGSAPAAVGCLDPE